MKPVSPWLDYPIIVLYITVFAPIALLWYGGRYVWYQHVKQAWPRPRY